MNAFSFLIDAEAIGLHKNLDSILLQNLLYFLCHIRVLTGKQLRRGLNNGDAAAETAEQLSKLDCDVAASKNQQMLGHAVEFHDGNIVERRHMIETCELGPRWARSCVDEHSLRRQGSFTTVSQLHGNGFGIDEAGLSEYQVEIFSFFQGLLAAVAETIDDIPFALADFLHIDTDRTGAYSIICRPASQIRDASARDHGFRRRASFIDARATDVFSLDNGGAHAGLGQRNRERS